MASAETLELAEVKAAALDLRQRMSANGSRLALKGLLGHPAPVSLPDLLRVEVKRVEDHGEGAEGAEGGLRLGEKLLGEGEVALKTASHECFLEYLATSGRTEGN